MCMTAYTCHVYAGVASCHVTFQKKRETVRLGNQSVQPLVRSSLLWLIGASRTLWGWAPLALGNELLVRALSLSLSRARSGNKRVRGTAL